MCRGLSRRLTALEDSVGSRLLIRGGREFTLTAQGQAARESAEQIEEAVAQVSRLVRSEHLSSGGTVRVSVSPGFIVPMMPMLDIARIKYPNLDIQLLGDYRRVDLAKGEADIAVRMARPDELGLVGRHPLVLYAESMHNVPPLRWLETHRDAATRFTRVDNLEIATQLILAGNGIGLLPCFTAAAHPELLRMMAEPVIFVDGWIVYHETLRGTARVRAVVDLMIEFFEANAPFLFRAQANVIALPNWAY